MLARAWWGLLATPGDPGALSYLLKTIDGDVLSGWGQGWDQSHNDWRQLRPAVVPLPATTERWLSTQGETPGEREQPHLRRLAEAFALRAAGSRRENLRRLQARLATTGPISSCTDGDNSSNGKLSNWRRKWITFSPAAGAGHYRSGAGGSATALKGWRRRGALCPLGRVPMISAP